MLNAEAQNPGNAWLDGALDRFEAANASLVGETRDMLSRIAPEPATHARLLNTLSLLEHIGSHKIMATQHSAGIDQSTLRHVAEEAHHAFFMKRQAEKTAGSELDYADANLIAAPSARMYFQRLEAAVVRRLGPSVRAVYLYMSMIVEFRALWFYRLYQQTLKKAGVPISLKRILGEEENHLLEMARQLEAAGTLDGEDVDAFVDAERVLYGRMLGAIRHAIA